MAVQPSAHASNLRRNSLLSESDESELPPQIQKPPINTTSPYQQLLHFTSLHPTSLSHHFIIATTSLLSTALHCVPLHFASLHFTSAPHHFTSRHHFAPLTVAPLHSTSLRFTSLHSTSLHFASLHFTPCLVSRHPASRANHRRTTIDQPLLLKS